MIDKNITTKLHFFLCFGMVISICYWANCIRGKTTISRKSKKCRIVCWKFLFVAGSTANDRIALLQAFNVNEMRPRNCALLAMSFINEVVNLVPKHDVFIVECYPILAIMCNISERYDVNSHDFFQWGSGKISPVDVATTWSHRPYYRSVINTLMVGLPLYQ